jgi:histidinol-phosphate aminotransferase
MISMNIEEHLSSLTTSLVAQKDQGYVSRDIDELSVIESLKCAHNLKQVYRFDIGKSTDGPSPLIHEIVQTPEVAKMVTGSLTEYPDNHYHLLRKQLARMHELEPSQFTFGAGLEGIIDQISRAVLDPRDKVLIPIPNFDLFESGSLRMGAQVIYVPLVFPEFRWTENTTETLQKEMIRQRIKLMWISNPVNPTGQRIPLAHIQRLVETAKETKTIVVIDEAYGEYVDQPDEICSASRFVKENPHLMVLRTFSKIYCLPSARVGYMICTSQKLVHAVNSYRPVFPFSWFSLYMTQLAVIDNEHLNMIRSKLSKRKDDFLKQAHFLDLETRGFTFLDSDANTIMFKHKHLSAKELLNGLARQGFLTANLNRLSGIEDQQFLRLTLHNKEVNGLFLQACASLS